MGGGHPKLTTAGAICCQNEEEYSRGLTFTLIMKTTLQAITKYIKTHTIGVLFYIGYISKRTHTFVYIYR